MGRKRMMKMRTEAREGTERKLMNQQGRQDSFEKQRTKTKVKKMKERKMKMKKMMTQKRKATPVGEVGEVASRGRKMTAVEAVCCC